MAGVISDRICRSHHHTGVLDRIAPSVRFKSLQQEEPCRYKADKEGDDNRQIEFDLEVPFGKPSSVEMMLRRQAP